MRNSVQFKNPESGAIKKVKVGWSWVLFLFSSFLGIPLFLRQLYFWGVIVLLTLTADVVMLSGLISGEDYPQLFFISSLLSYALLIFLSVKGNEMTARNYLKNGWEWVEPDSDEVRYAKGKWGML